jgi:crotonobetainyl-CoA:carnitine CoA-transferase CaiB-like acyl-CoA transferase
MEGQILEGLRVIELASVLAGPAVGMFLAEMGAEVIKIEHFRMGGDVTRSWKLASESQEEDRSAYFSAVNWGKMSVGVDLSTEKGKALIYKLVEGADIVLASFKPGDAEKLGMDAGTLRGLQPRLIYADLTAYGPDDPRVGFDAIIQAESGFTYLNGETDGPAVKMPVALMDLLAAHQLKEGILLALLRRERTGEGMLVRTSLIGAGMASLANQATNWLVAGQVPSRMGSNHPNIAPYGRIYPTRDGKAIVPAVGNDRQFAGLCTCLGAPELANRVEFARNPDRVANRGALDKELEVLFLRHDRDELLNALHKAQVPAGALRDMQDVFSQDWAKEALLKGESFTGVRSVALAGMGKKNLTEPPHLGQDTRKVLQTILQLSREEVDGLYENGTIGEGGK